MADQKFTPQQQEQIWKIFCDEISACTFDDLKQEKVAETLTYAVKTVMSGQADDDFSPAGILDDYDPEETDVDSQSTIDQEQQEQEEEIIEPSSDDFKTTELPDGAMIIDLADDDSKVVVTKSENTNEETIENDETGEIKTTKETTSVVTEKTNSKTKTVSSQETTTDVKSEVQDTKQESEQEVAQPSTSSAQPQDDSNIALSDIFNSNQDLAEDEVIESETVEKESFTEKIATKKTTTSVTPGVVIQKGKEFQVFDHRLEKEIDKELQKNKDWDEEFNKFMFDEKQVFPMMKGKISLFGVYLIKYFLNLINDKSFLNPKYTVNLQIDDDRAPAHLIQLWEANTKGLHYTQDQDTNTIYFSDKESADEMIKIIRESTNTKQVDCIKTKSSDFDFKLDTVLPINSKNIVTYPDFSLNNTSKIIDSFLDVEEFLNVKFKKGPAKGKTYIKVMKYDEWKKGKWISYFTHLKEMFSLVLTKEERETFEFDTPENIYEKLIHNPDIEEIKLFVIRDLEVTPKDFESFKHDKHFNRMYELIYNSWIKFLIIPQKEKEVLEKFEYNMYTFVCDTRIYSKKGPMLFRSNFFVDFEPYIRPLPPIALDQELSVPVKNLFVKKERIGGFSINQLNLLFSKHQTNWLNFYFITETLVSLIENDLIDVYKNNIILNENFKLYYDIMKKENFNIFFDNVSAAFDSYFAKDVKSFAEKIAVINKKPF